MDPSNRSKDIEKPAVATKDRDPDEAQQASALQQEKAASLISPRITAIRGKVAAKSEDTGPNQPPRSGISAGPASALQQQKAASLISSRITAIKKQRKATAQAKDATLGQHATSSNSPGAVKSSKWRGLNRKTDKVKGPVTKTASSAQSTERVVTDAHEDDSTCDDAAPPSTQVEGDEDNASTQVEGDEDNASVPAQSTEHVVTDAHEDDSTCDDREPPFTRVEGDEDYASVQFHFEADASSNQPPSEEYAGTDEVEEGLAVAIPVNESSRVILSSENAQEMDVKKEEERLEAQRKKTFVAVAVPIASCTLLFIIGLIIVVALVVFRSKKTTTNEAPSVPTAQAEPSEAPMSSPTSAPTLFLMNLPSYMNVAMMTPFTPQSRARDWLDEYPNIESEDEWKKEQLYALATFFYSFHGDEQWPTEIRDDWLDYFRSECDWWSFSFVVRDAIGGVNAFEGPEDWVLTYDLLGHYANASTCTVGDRFVALDFSGFPIANASLPAEISRLSSLKTISLYRTLSDTRLDNLLPSELGLLPNLTSFQVTYNTLPGTIPTEVGLLMELQTLHLYYNALRGTMPSEVGLLTALTDLRLDWNPITGTIPSEIGLLSDLKQLQLWKTGISGQLPSQIGLLTALTNLDLYETSITGTIPTEVGLMSSLSVLYMTPDLGRPGRPLSSQIKKVFGALPSELGLLSNLTILHVMNNANITGTFPTEICLLTGLELLELSGNALTGALPTELGLMTALTSLHLSSNLLSGSVPSEISLLTGLTSYWALDLSSNSISGMIPSELGRMDGLESIDLSVNSISGTLPTELGRMSQLEWPGLVLSFNSISGTLPTELASLKNLTTLALTRNMLSGSIPTEFGNLINMFTLVLANNSITGTIPTELGRTGLSSFDVSFNVMTGQIPSELGLLFYQDWMGYTVSLLGNNFTTLPVELCYMLLEREDDFSVDCAQTDCGSCQ